MITTVSTVVIVAILAGIVYAGMWALATFVKPTPREIVTPVTLPKAPK